MLSPRRRGQGSPFDYEHLHRDCVKGGTVDIEAQDVRDREDRLRIIANNKKTDGRARQEAKHKAFAEVYSG